MDIEANNSVCEYIRCRRSSFNVPYTNSLSTLQGIQGIVTMAGYDISRIVLDDEVPNP